MLNLKKILVGALGLGVLTTSVLACDCQKDDQALEIGRTQQVIIVINHFNSKLDKSGKVKLIGGAAAKAEAFGKSNGENQASEVRAFNKESVVIKSDNDNKMFSTSLNKDLRLENKNDLLK